MDAQTSKKNGLAKGQEDRHTGRLSSTVGENDGSNRMGNHIYR